MDQKIVTKSGVEITQDDVRDIQKKSARETVRNVLALVGGVALFKIGRDYIENRNGTKISTDV